MKPKYLLTAVLMVGAAKMSFAQYSQDAIRFSTSQSGTTSRIKAIGGAGTAIGGDLSSISGNPAGLGFFTRSEMSITPEFNGSKSQSTFLGSANKASTNNANFNNASVVFYTKINKPRGEDKTKGLLSLNFGIGYSRTNNFYQHVYYSGANKTSSIADYYAQLANNSNYLSGGYALLPDGSLENMAYSQYLIDSTGLQPGGKYAFYEPNTALNPNPQQSRTIARTGGQSEYAFSMGANFSNKFYLGLGLGITDIRYNSTSVFNEYGYEFVYFKTNYNSAYTLDQVTKGTGFNARLGFIYKPVEAIRIGATVTTPTWYDVEDNTNEGLNTKYTSQPAMDNSQNYQLTYNFRTPWKISGGIAAFIGHYGFISADIDYLDYSGTHINDNQDYDNSLDNADIKTLYQSAVNARFGAEARLTSNFFLRGGYGIQGNPMKNYGSDIKSVTGGFGYRFQQYYIDLAYVHRSFSETQYPYVLDASSAAISPVANLSNSENNVFLTLGLRF